MLVIETIQIFKTLSVLSSFSLKENKNYQMDKFIKLNESGITLYEKEHIYTDGVKEYQGITGVLSRQLFPDKYSSVPVMPHYTRLAADRIREFKSFDCIADKYILPYPVTYQNNSENQSTY